MKKGFDTWEEARSVYDMSVENISLNQWLNMWGRLCRGTAGISGENYFLNTLFSKKYAQFWLALLIIWGTIY